MAGLGRRVFNAGDILTAAQVQGFLQDQAIMVFSGTASRATAIPSPSEGMFAYLTDVDILYFYDGSDWAGFPSSLTDTLITNPNIVGGTATQTNLVAPDEKIAIYATAASGTVTLNSGTAGITYFTTAATGNFVIDVRSDGTANVNELINTGQSVTHAFLVTNAGTAYYPTEIQIDGGTANVTTRWQGGSDPASGNINSVDAYLLSVIKTADATFSVFGGQTQYA